MSNGAPTAIPARIGPYTLEEAIPLIQAKVEEKGGVDSFKVKVLRRAGVGSAQVHVASMEEATIQHLANPEQWLPVLAGGSPIYIFAVAHATENVPFVNFQLATLPGSPHEVDPEIAKSPEWKGPAVISFPPPKTQKPQDASSELARLRNLFGAPTPTTGTPAREGPEGSAVTGGGSGASPAAAELARLERRMESEKLERALVEMQKRTDAQIAALAETIKSVAAAVAAPREPVKSVAAQLVEMTPLITALATFATPLIVKSREASEAAEARRAEEATRRQEREDKVREELMKILTDVQTRASGAASDTVKMMSPIVEAVNVMSRTMLQNIATMKELSAGEQGESEFVAVAKAALGALGEYAAAKASAGVGPAAPRQLPPHAPPAQSNPPPAGEEAEEAEYIRGLPPEEILQQTKDAILREHDPKELADSFLDAMALNAGVRDAVTQAGGALPLFRARINDDAWLQAHIGYVQKLVSTLTNAARERQAAAERAQQPAQPAQTPPPQQ